MDTEVKCQQFLNSISKTQHPWKDTLYENNIRIADDKIKTLLNNMINEYDNTSDSNSINNAIWTRSPIRTDIEKSKIRLPLFQRVSQKINTNKQSKETLFMSKAMKECKGIDPKKHILKSLNDEEEYNDSIINNTDEKSTYSRSTTNNLLIPKPSEVNSSPINISNKEMTKANLIEVFEASQQKNNKVIRNVIPVKTQKNHQIAISSSVEPEGQQYKTINNKGKSLKNLDQTTEQSFSDMKFLTKGNLNKITRICNQLKKTLYNNSKTFSFDIISSNNSDTESWCSTEEYSRKLQSKTQVYDSLSDDQIQDQIKHIFRIPLNSNIFFIYDFIIILCVFYTLIISPLMILTDKSYNNHLVTTNIEIMIDFIFILDIFFNFFISYITCNDNYTSSNNIFLVHYITSWFILDWITAVPINTYCIIHYSSKHNQGSNIYRNLSGNPNKILRLHRTLKIFKVVLTNKWFRVFREFVNDKLSFQIGRLIFSIFYYWLIQHLMVCVFILLSENSNDNWISQNLIDKKDVYTLYWTSSYFIVATVTTVGYGDINIINIKEKIFNLFLMFLGILWYSLAITSISTYIQSKNEKTMKYRIKWGLLEDIREAHDNMSNNLYNKIYRFLAFEHRNHTLDKHCVYNCIPLSWRNDLINQMYKPIIKNFLFFKVYKNSDYIARIILALKPAIRIKNDVLVTEGDFIESIMFVKQGTLALQLPWPNWKVQKNHTNVFNILNKRYFNDIKDRTWIDKLKTKTKKLTNDYQWKSILNNANNKEIIYAQLWEIHKNEHFGDILMFCNKRSPLKVKVKSKKIELFLLDKSDSMDIWKDYPKIWDDINTLSIFNMEQIEKLIKTVIMLFINSKLQFFKDIKKGEKTRKVGKKYKETEIIKAEEFNSWISNKDNDRLMFDPYQWNRNKKRVWNKSLIDFDKDFLNNRESNGNVLTEKDKMKTTKSFRRKYSAYCHCSRCKLKNSDWKSNDLNSNSNYYNDAGDYFVSDESEVDQQSSSVIENNFIMKTHKMSTSSINNIINNSTIVNHNNNDKDSSSQDRINNWIICGCFKEEPNCTERVEHNYNNEYTRYPQSLMENNSEKSLSITNVHSFTVSNIYDNLYLWTGRDWKKTKKIIQIAINPLSNTKEIKSESSGCKTHLINSFNDQKRVYSTHKLCETNLSKNTKEIFVKKSKALLSYNYSLPLLNVNSNKSKLVFRENTTHENIKYFDRNNFNPLTKLTKPRYSNSKKRRIISNKRIQWKVSIESWERREF